MGICVPIQMSDFGRIVALQFNLNALWIDAVNTLICQSGHVDQQLGAGRGVRCISKHTGRNAKTRPSLNLQFLSRLK
jgi:hypothetical protein